MNPAAHDIWVEHWNIERKYRERRNALTKDLDAEQHKEVAALQARCERETGHTFRYLPNVGICGTTWYVCDICGATKHETDPDDSG